MEEKKEKTEKQIAEDKEIRRRRILWVISIGSVLLIAVLWYINYVYGNNLCKEKRGVFGDMFGAVNAIFSGLAFAGIIISLYLQRIDLKNQFEEVQKTNEQFGIQNNTLQIQKFENQYYKMIDLHRENVNDIIIPYTGPRGNSIKSSNSTIRELKGKKAFVDMVKELEVCLLVCHDNLDLPDKKYEKIEINHYAYKIFFWGVNSNFTSSNIISDKDQTIVKDLIKKIQTQFIHGIRDDKGIAVKTRYVPFQGHESRLAHYYRHLFQTVKYVVNQKEKKLITYDETRQYLRVLRAQLSNSEQLMLYYNYICGFGINWDRLGNKGYQFFTKYRMIHNIPMNRVKIVEKPKEHFKDYIKQLNSVDDPMFELGDK